MYFWLCFLCFLIVFSGGGTLLFLYFILMEFILDVFLYYSLALLLCFDLVLEFSMVLKF